MTKKNTESVKSMGVVEAERKKKVCIMGFAPSWKETPFENQDYEIWTLNEAYKLAEQQPKFRADRWFEIHDRNSPSKNTEEHMAFLRQCPCPVYMWQHYDDIPNSVKFPKDDVVEFFSKRGCSGSEYFTNSISWFVALAIYEGYEEILITGVDMAQDSEYQAQRPSVEFWIGYAEGMGIKVTIPPTSDILKATQMYGFESNNRNRAWIKAQTKELGKRMNQHRNNELQYQQALLNEQLAQAELRGAKSAYNEVLVRTQ